MARHHQLTRYIRQSLARHGNKLGAFAIGLAMVLGLSATGPAAGDVVLNPGYIDGQVKMGTEPLLYARMYASGGGFVADSYVYAETPGDTFINYHLTVDVPVGGTRDYSVRAQNVYMDGYRDYFSFYSKTVTVADGATSNLDFVENNPGFIEGTFTVNGVAGASTFSNARLYGYYTDGQGHNFQTYSYQAQAGSYKIAVIPGDVRINPQITLSSGVTITLPQETLTVGPGQHVIRNFDVVPATGVISGNIAMPGAEPVNYHRVYVSGPSYKNVYPQVDGPYALTELPDGTYYTYAYTYFDNISGYFYHPTGSFTPGRNATIAGSSTETIDIYADQAFIEGVVDVHGSATFADVTYLNLNAYGVYQTPSYGGSASLSGNATNGQYKLVLTDGEWRMNALRLNFYRNVLGDFSDRFSEYLYINFYNNFLQTATLTADDTVNRNFDLPMGKVTVNFSVLGGGTLSNPKLQIGCSLYDDQVPPQILMSYSGESTGLGQSNVPTGTASFLAPEGACTVTARATVDGTTTSFGTIEIDVEPGVDQDVDIGGPSLTITHPSPEFYTTNNTIVFTGTATDDVEVESVTVDGVAVASMTTTAGPPDHEISFVSQSIGLDPGPNEIETIATDTSGKSAKDKRTVYYDFGPPELDWTPADGTVTSLFTATVVGTADDDAGIASIKVDGNSVAFTPTGNGNEVSFSTTVSLVLGANSITVVATDISELETTQTHVVTVADNSPPVADANGPYSVNEGGSIPLDGTGSTDPDNDALTYEWDLDNNGSFETTGATPTFSAAALDGPSVQSVVLRVTDTSGASDTATATVSVLNVAPAVSAGADRIINEGGGITLAASFIDPGVADTHTVSVNWGDGGAAGTGLGGSHVYANNGIYTVTVTVTDDDGGVGSDSLTVTVNNVAPTAAITLASAAIDENGVATVNGTFTDPGVLDTHAVSINWGDGRTSAATVTQNAGSGSFTASIQYLDDDPTATPSDNWPIMATVSDNDGGSGQASAALTVYNLAPEVAVEATVPVDPVALGDAISVSVPFSDTGSLDTHAVSWNWGDGTSSSGTVAGLLAAGSHVYAAPGIYLVSCSIVDDDTGVAACGSSTFIVIYDPNGGFVTGGGWIDSWVGAYRPDPSLSGKATFGFVAKYKKGATTPSGNTEFQFHAAGMNFHSSNYDWLVVAGARAQFKGTGTVNGGGNFGFFLTAIDGDVSGGGGVDKFRIRIWNKDAGNGVVYDNQSGDTVDDADPSTAISKGQIVIHSNGKK